MNSLTLLAPPALLALLAFLAVLGTLGCGGRPPSSKEMDGAVDSDTVCATSAAGVAVAGTVLPGQRACQGLPGAVCVGEEIFDQGPYAGRNSVVDIVDLGPEMFAVGSVEALEGGVKYRPFSTLDIQPRTPIRLTVPGPPPPLSMPMAQTVWLRANSSKAVERPGVVCTSPSATWGQYTNYFAVQVGSRIYLDTVRLCDGVTTVSRTLIDEYGSGPSIATTPEGTALVVYGGRDYLGAGVDGLAGRYIHAPPGLAAGGPTALLGETFVIASSVSNQTDVIYNYDPASDAAQGTFIVGIKGSTNPDRPELFNIGNILIANGATTAKGSHADSGSGDATTGGHTTRAAFNPLGDGTALWWHTGGPATVCDDDRGLFPIDATGVFAEAAGYTELATSCAGPSPPMDGFHDWVPVASTYDESDLPLRYVFFLTDYPGSALHLYGLKADKTWVMVDPLGTTGVLGSPLAIRSLRSATVGVTRTPYNQALRLLVIDRVSPWPASPMRAYGVASGTHHSCALRTAGLERSTFVAEEMWGGVVSCWGGNGFGQLGHGTTVDSPVPITVPGLNHVTSLAAGDTNTCALQGRSVWCWGAAVTKDGRQVGDRTTACRSTPAAVLSGSSSDYPVAIASRGDHTCALSFAEPSNIVRCWGANDAGQLDDHTFVNRREPTIVVGLTDPRAIATGAAFTCALTGDGAVSCWGANDFGQLGDGTGIAQLVPTLVSTPFKATAISAGAGHACALGADGTVACWGRNDVGQLGDGTTTDSSVPVFVTGLTGVTAIALGTNHSCALLQDGTVSCWGAHEPVGIHHPTPTPVQDLYGVLSVSAGNDRSCVGQFDGTIACWGRNHDGALGDGTTVDSAVPVFVRF